MKKILAFVLLVVMLVMVAGCTTENAESSNDAEESVDGAEMSEVIYGSEAAYITFKFKSFAEFYELLALANGDDIEAFREYFEKDGIIPPQKSKVAEMFEAFSEMSVPVLECEEYQLSVILCDLYLDGRYYIELVYNGENDRLRAGAHTLSNSISADDNVTSVVADTVDLGEYSIQLKTMAKENSYCDIKGKYSADGYGIYMAYRGGTVLPESLKQGLTLATLEELIKPYVE